MLYLRGDGEDSLVVAEKRVLLLADFDGAAAELCTFLLACTHLNPVVLIHILSSLLFSLSYTSSQQPAPCLPFLPFQPRTCGIKTLSPGATDGATLLPSLSTAPGPTASTFASLSSLTAVSGRKMPPAVLASGFMRCTRMRSSSGAMERIDLMADWGWG